MDSSTDSRNRPGTERFAEPASLFFNRFGVLVILGGLILAAWAKLTVIVVILGLILAAAGITRLWSRLSLVGVSCERSLSENRVFPGENVELKLRVANRKLLPLPWVIVSDDIPQSLVPELTLEQGTHFGSGLLNKGTSLLWYTSASWRQNLTCNKRGYYRLGPLTVTSGDIFGMYPRARTVADVEHIIVYPRIFPITRLEPPSLAPSGETRAYRPIFEDPIRLVGVREYTPHDSLRRIHWKATARHQVLQVKVFEPTTALKVAIFLGIDTFESGSARLDEDFELGVSTAASLADYLVGKRNPVGLFVNTKLADLEQEAHLLPGSGVHQLTNILELLAKVTHMPTRGFDSFIQDEVNGLPYGTTMIFIFSRLPPALPSIADDLKHSGNRIMMFQIGTHEEAPPDWESVRSSEDLAAAGLRTEL